MQAKRVLASVAALLMVLAALSPTVLSTSHALQGAATGAVGPHNLTAVLTVSPTSVNPRTEFAPGETVHATVRVLQSPSGNYSGNVTATFRSTTDNLTLHNETRALAPWDGNASGTFPVVQFAYAVPANATPGTHTVTFRVVIDDLDANATSNGTLAAQFLVTAPGPVLPDPGTPWALILLVAGAVLLVGGAGYAVAQRRRRPKVAPRSRALQQIEAERRLERLDERAEDNPEAAAEAQAIREELRTQEAARQKSRELMILEAKREDALKSMDLLRKRRETGQLTELQFTKMMEKKQQQYEGIEREIAEMERRDAEGAPSE